MKLKVKKEKKEKGSDEKTIGSKRLLAFTLEPSLPPKEGKKPQNPTAPSRALRL